MYIEPNTTIRLLKNIPLDNRYTNTIYFADTTAQYNYFVSHTKLPILNDQTYQRVHKGVARIGIKAEDLYDCNYMMFQNTNFGSKWFYAFITGVEYINNVVSEITYEIDVLQTWLLECEIKECYVEREHTETDNVGDNIVTEPVDLGPIICSSIKTTGLFDSYVAVIAKAKENEVTS